VYLALPNNFLQTIILPRIWGVCVIYRGVLDRMTGFIDTLYTNLVTIINRSSIAISTFDSLLLHIIIIIISQTASGLSPGGSVLQLHYSIHHTTTNNKEENT
jgi:hypothetical protein